MPVDVPTCQRRSADGVCVDLLPYSAAAREYLRDALVVIRDAGGALVEDNWDDEETRNVTGELVYGRNHATSAEFTYTVNMTVLSNSSQTYLEARRSMVAWCHNGEGSDPIPRFCRPRDDISLSNSEAASEPILQSCGELDCWDLRRPPKFCHKNRLLRFTF